MIGQIAPERIMGGYTPRWVHPLVMYRSDGQACKRFSDGRGHKATPAAGTSSRLIVICRARLAIHVPHAPDQSATKQIVNMVFRRRARTPFEGVRDFRQRRNHSGMGDGKIPDEPEHVTRWVRQVNTRFDGSTGSIVPLTMIARGERGSVRSIRLAPNLRRVKTGFVELYPVNRPSRECFRRSPCVNL